MYQLMITIGILGAYLSDTAFSYSGAWRWMLGVIIIPALLLLVGVIFLPDSPRWFAAKRRFVDAERVLLRLRDTSAEAKRELDEIRESLQVKQSGWALFKENSNFRRAVFLGVLLQVMQQFTGMNVIMYYAPKIFELAGYTNTTEQMWGTVIVGLTNVLATFIAIGLVDRWGRKPTLILGFIVMAVGMGVLGTMMHVGIHSASAQYFAVLMLLMFIVGFAMSAGPLIWVLCSEIQPLKGRDFGITCSTATNWIANMIVGATFLTMLNSLGSATTFWVYGGLNVLFIFLTLWLIPETKNVSLEHIGFAMSAGPLIWVLCSEIQPLKGRDFGITCSTATNWIANMIVGATFLTMLNSLGSATTFWVYGGLNVLFIFLTLWLIPETKNVSLEHIERNLMKGRKLREIGAHD